MLCCSLSKKFPLKKKKSGRKRGKIFNPLVVVYRYENSIGNMNPGSRRKGNKQEGKLSLLLEGENLYHSVLFWKSGDIFYFNENHIGFCVCSNVQNKLKLAFSVLSHITPGMWLCFWPGEIRLGWVFFVQT